MDMEKLVELASKAGVADQLASGHQTLGYLIDMLKMCDPDMPCTWASGYTGLGRILISQHDGELG